MINLYHGDCLIEHEHIEDGSVDLILTDLPYGTMNGFNDIDWDFAIDPFKVYKIADKILRAGGKLVLFSQEPYTTNLIKSATSNIVFKYKAVWEKDTPGNSLMSKSAMVGTHEDILIISKDYELDKSYTPTNPAYYYLQECKKESRMTTTDFNLLYSNHVGKKTNRHRGMVARCWETSQFWFPSKDVYDNVLKPTGYFKLSYEELSELNNDKGVTFNLWEGKKQKRNVLKYSKDNRSYHPTQKPIALLEDLIKTFSNEDDLVVDLTMGSGSTGVACVNTNRRFTGIEMDDKYFNVAKERISASQAQTNIFDFLEVTE